METKSKKSRQVKTEASTTVCLLEGKDEGKRKHLPDAVTGRPLRTVGAASLGRRDESHHRRFGE